MSIDTTASESASRSAERAALRALLAEADRAQTIMIRECGMGVLDVRVLEQARAALAAPPAEPVALTDERIDYIADKVVKAMPEGLRGFCRVWGWQQFARELLSVCSVRAVPPAEQKPTMTPGDLVASLNRGERWQLVEEEIPASTEQAHLVDLAARFQESAEWLLHGKAYPQGRGVGALQFQQAATALRQCVADAALAAWQGQAIGIDCLPELPMPAAILAHDMKTQTWAGAVPADADRHEISLWTRQQVCEYARRYAAAVAERPQAHTTPASPAKVVAVEAGRLAAIDTCNVEDHFRAKWPDLSSDKLDWFFEGVRFAEQRHGVGGAPASHTEPLTWHLTTAPKRPDADEQCLLWIRYRDGAKDWEAGWLDGDGWRLCESGGLVDGEVLAWAQPGGPAC